MAKITEYQEALGLDQNDVFLKDGTGGTKKIKWETLKDIIAPIDDTLSEAGKAADAKKVGDELTDLKSATNEITSNDKISTTPGYYINLNGTTADVADLQPSATMEYALISCQEGDTFTVSAQGSDTGRAYGFVDAEGTILAVGDPGQLYVERAITAPENTIYLVVNSFQYPAKIFKNKLVKRSIAEITTKIDGIENELYEEKEIAWHPGATYQYGWKPGYYNGSIGGEINNNSSNYYMRAVYIVYASDNYPDLWNCRTLKFVPPEDKNIQVIQVSIATGLITEIYHSNNSDASPDNKNEPIIIPFDVGSQYYVNVGRYADGSAATKVEDPAYCKSIKLIATIPKSVAIDKSIETLNNNIEAVNSIITEKLEISWQNNWERGYYKSEDGTPSGISNFYIRTNTAYTFPSNISLIQAEIPASSGYGIRIFEYDANDNDRFIGYYGSAGADNPTPTLVISNTPTHKYKFMCGRFADQSASDKLSDPTFMTSLKLFETRTMQMLSKKERTGDFEWFTVDVERPLSFGGEETETTTETIECVLRLPETYSSVNTPTRLILACHGAHGYIDSANSIWYNANWKTFMDALLDAGYAVFDANVLPLSAGISPENVAGYALGSPLYINVLKKAYDYIVNNYNVYPQIFAHGTSMGGVGATAFSHAYPKLVLAESSFAGRDFLRYLIPVYDNTIDDRVAPVYGYDSVADLLADKFSHADGAFPSLSLVKYVNGIAQIPPDRETAFSDWLAYYIQVADLARTDDAGIWMGKRTVPYKAWNSWADNVGYTKLEEVLAKAYNTGNKCPYYAVAYDTGTHTEMSYGQINNMIPQLLEWYKRWE